MLLMRHINVDLLMTRLDWFVDCVVIANAVVILLTTGHLVNPIYEHIAEKFLIISSLIFIVEIMLRLIYLRMSFWRNGWNMFDLLVTAISSLYMIPSVMSLRLLRLVRLSRLFRLFSLNSHLRNLTNSLVIAFPRVLWTGVFFASLFIIYATIGIDIYGKTHPEHFGSIGDSFYSLFQIMTLESWSSGIAKDIMQTHTYSWLYFVSFILISTYILLNLLFGVITSAAIEAYEKGDKCDNIDELKDELKGLYAKLEIVERMLAEKKSEEK